MEPGTTIVAIIAIVASYYTVKKLHQHKSPARGTDRATEGTRADQTERDRKRRN